MIHGAHNTNDTVHAKHIANFAWITKITGNFPSTSPLEPQNTALERVIIDQKDQILELRVHCSAKCSNLIKTNLIISLESDYLFWRFF